METQEQFPKTREDVKHLKACWCKDPCWDIETTEGFEEYAAELKAFSEMMSEQWEQERNERLQVKATQIGVPGNTVLAAYILCLESRLEQMQEKLDKLICG